MHCGEAKAPAAKKKGSKSHDPARKRQGFRVRKRPPVCRPRSSPQKEAMDKLYEHDVETLQPGTQCGILSCIQDVAPLLWKAEYASLFAAELTELGEIGVLGRAMETKCAAPMSSYTRRGKVRDKEKKMTKDISNAQDAAAMAVRQANQQTYPISICARSVAFYMRRVNIKDWSELLSKRMVLSRTTTVKLIKAMMKCRPPFGFRELGGVVCVIFDQCHKKKGLPRGEHRAGACELAPNLFSS